jgi:hypothetical protein
MDTIHKPAIGGYGTALLTRYGVMFDPDDDQGVGGGWDGSIDDADRIYPGQSTAVADPEPAPDPEPAADPATPPDPAPTPPEAGTPPASDGPQPGETVAEWRARFADEQAMWQGFRSAEAELTRTKQEAAEYRRQLEQLQQQEQEYDEPVDPLQALPIGISDELYDRIVASAQHDLPGTAKHIVENLEEFRRAYGPGMDEIAGQLMQGWAQRDYFAATRFQREQDRAAILAELRQEQQQVVAPLTKAQTDQWVKQAHDLAGQKAPDLDEFKGQISQVVQANPQWLAGTYGRPDLMAERILQIRDLLWAAREREKLTQAAAPQPAAPAAPPVVPSAAPAPAAPPSPADEYNERRAREIHESWDATPVR